MNQFSLNLQPSDTLWYTPTQTMENQHQKPYPFFYHHNNNNNNNNPNYSDNDSETNSTTNQNDHQTLVVVEKEHMFEKPLTPSDVGKLNRLVIPKQHAEKYLPLAAATTTTIEGGGVGGGGGGLLLGFEDESGKCWRFRYSYWNSSQSYVLTKGWSRYVKEKKLDAGDIVLFERHRFEPDRFFIGWRRRGSNPPVHLSSPWTPRSTSSYHFNIHNNNHNNNNNYNHHNVVHQISVFPNLPPESLHEGTVQVRQKAKKSSGGNSKRVRLFGVNLECKLEEEDEDIIEDEPQTSDGSSLSSQGHVQGYGSGLTMGPTSYNHFEYVGYSPNHHNHNMDMNFPHDVNQQMRLG